MDKKFNPRDKKNRSFVTEVASKWILKRLKALQ